MENVANNRHLIRGLLLDGINKPQVIDIEDNPDGYKKVLDCSHVGAITRTTMFGEKTIIIVYNGEKGLTRHKKFIPSAVAFNYTFDDITEIIFGKIFICNYGCGGTLVSLNDEDIKNIKESITNLGKDFKFSDNFGNVGLPSENCLVYT